MKKCPICNSLAFDDAAMCFGCLHPFGGNGAPPSPSSDDPEPMGAHALREEASRDAGAAPHVDDASSSACAGAAQNAAPHCLEAGGADLAALFDPGKPLQFLVTIAPLKATESTA